MVGEIKSEHTRVSMDWFEEFFACINDDQKQIKAEDTIKYFTDGDESEGVYFIYNKQTKLFRIGMSSSPTRRIEQHERATGCNITVLGILYPYPYFIKNSRDIESFIHGKTRKYKKHKGDWIEITPEIALTIVWFLREFDFNSNGEFHAIYEMNEPWEDTDKLLWMN